MNGKNKKIRNDLLLICGILAIALIVFAIFRFTLKDGTIVSVSVNGVITAEYPLTEDFETIISTGDNAQQINVLVIKNGEVYISSASCPDKICADHRAISKVGETIICLPHKVVITINEGSN